MLDLAPQSLAILPGRGWGSLLLGEKASRLRRRLGPPDVCLGDARIEGQEWHYFGPGLELIFEARFGERLYGLNFRRPGPHYQGVQVGSTEAELQRMLDVKQHSAVYEYYEELGLWVYELESQSLSFYLAEGVVDSISMAPLWSTRDELPIWPTAGSF